MTDRYTDLRAALADGWVQSIHPDTARDLLAGIDELERALTLSGKANKRLMDELADLVAERDALREACELIAVTDSVDAALDPQRAIRVARAALAQGEA